MIDAEGSTFDVLAEFKRAKRIIVTPLRPARAPELDLRFSPGSYYRPFRDGDELRIATCTLTRRSTNESLELGALLVRREHRESDTVLLTTGIELGMEGRSLAELYYTRWPVQESAQANQRGEVAGTAAAGGGQRRGRRMRRGWRGGLAAWIPVPLDAG